MFCKPKKKIHRPGTKIHSSSSLFLSLSLSQKYYTPSMTKHSRCSQRKQAITPFTHFTHIIPQIYFLHACTWPALKCCVNSTQTYFPLGIPHSYIWAVTIVKLAITLIIQLLTEQKNSPTSSMSKATRTHAHTLKNSPAEGETEGWNSIRMVMAGERARLTEQESHPAFLWCDRKWSNCASVKHQRQTCIHKPRRRHPTRASFPSIRSCVVSQLTTRWVASHPCILKMPKEVAIRAVSNQTPALISTLHVILTLILLSVLQHPATAPCAPAIALSSDLQPPIFHFNASLPLCVKPQPQFLKECPQTSGQPPAANQHPDHPCKIANLPKKTTQLLRLWETENISSVFTCSQYFSPFFFFSLCLCDSDCQHTDTSYIETVSVQISLSWSSSLDCQMLSLTSQSALILERSWDSLTALEGVNFSLWACKAGHEESKWIEIAFNCLNSSLEVLYA